MFYVFPRVVSPDVCEQITKDCKKNILKEASVLGFDRKGRDNPEVRKTSIYFIKDKSNKVNELVWNFLRKANEIQFHYDIEYFQAVQFAEYKNGGFYDWHQDASGIAPNNETRKLSLTLALSNPDTFKGGELQFYNGDRPMEDMGEITAEQIKNDIKAQGTVIVFDSRDFHRVTPVVDGTRHSIVCWTIGKNFK